MKNRDERSQYTFWGTVKWNLNQSFFVLLLNFSEVYSFLMSGESMAENIYDSASNMTATISVKHDLVL